MYRAECLLKFSDPVDHLPALMKQQAPADFLGSDKSDTSSLYDRPTMPDMGDAVSCKRSSYYHI
jgi:hypothetical protein